MRVLFAASEIGSVRAILPVAAVCADQGDPVLLADCGAMRQGGAGDIGPLLPPVEGLERMDAALRENDVSCVVFSSNVSDPVPLGLARRAQSMNIPCLHVLDYWNGYNSRLRLDGGPLFVPDVYAVPDELAKSGAEGEGISSERILVTGQPAFADMEQAGSVGGKERADLLRAHGFDPGLPLLLFVSEPVILDRGDDPTNELYRGYSETQVMSQLFAVLADCGVRLQVGVLPHPREDVGGLASFLETAGADIKCKLLRLERGRDALPMVSGVAGMASTLLYEAWLTGLPVASLQPGLRRSSLRTMQKRESVLFLDEAGAVARELPGWFAALEAGTALNMRPEVMLHVGASQVLRDVVVSMMCDSPRTTMNEKDNR